MNHRGVAIINHLAEVINHVFLLLMAARAESISKRNVLWLHVIDSKNMFKADRTPLASQYMRLWHQSVSSSPEPVWNHLLIVSLLTRTTLRLTCNRLISAYQPQIRAALLEQRWRALERTVDFPFSKSVPWDKWRISMSPFQQGTPLLHYHQL